MHRLTRIFISVLASTSLGANQILPAFADRDLTRADYENCQARDEDGFRSAIATIASDALKSGVDKVDFPAVVADEWRKSGIDDVIDKRVDIAVEEVKSETSWTERLKSLTNSETSQKLATSIAERVYRSEAVKTAMETLASGVAKEVGKTIEVASLDTATPVLACLKAFIGPRYGSAVAQAVAGDAGKDLAIDPDKGGAEISSSAVLKQSGGGIAGATILVVRRQLANLASRIGQRLVGSVLSRLVSVVAGGIGLVLIAKDLWDFRNGVLPIIATEMKAKATKEKVQEELAATLHEQINTHIAEIAAASADHVLEIWQSFKRAHALVLRLAESNGAFRAFLDGVQPDRLPRLDEVVGLLVPKEGEDGVIRRLGDGSLNEAVHLMPAKAMEIARDTQSVAVALAWSKISGDKLDQVADYELHKRTSPEDFTSASLARIFALDDRSAIIRLASIPRDARDALFSLDASDLKVLAKSLGESELTTLASYLKGLAQGPREQVLRAVAQNPAKMQVLASAQVRDAILASPDQSAAVTMMLETTSSYSPRAFGVDLTRAWQGQVSPWLIWNKYPGGVALMALLGLLVGLWLRRLVRPRKIPKNPAQSA